MTNESRPLIGIIIVAHGKCGEAMLKAAEFILGPQSDCVSISVESAHEMEEAARRLNDAAIRLDQGGGVLALTDMFGGTPTNLALSLLKQHQAEVVTGVNLPMLLKVFERRDSSSLEDLARLAGEAGKSAIVVAATMLKSRGRS